MSMQPGKPGAVPQHRPAGRVPRGSAPGLPALLQQSLLDQPRWTER